MPRISLKPGDSLTVGEDVAIRFDKFAGGRACLDVEDAYGDVSVARGSAPEPAREEIQDRLCALAREIVSGLSTLESARSKELLGVFVTELFLSAARQETHAKRSRRQAEAIAAAKAKGVRFGPQPRALPEGFEALRQAWRAGEMSLQEAADACGLPKSTFHDAALRAEASGQTASGEARKPPEKGRRKQAKAAPARSGPKPRALPEDFEELRLAWRNKKLSLKVAAEACGLPQSTFYSAAVRAEAEAG